MLKKAVHLAELAVCCLIISILAFVVVGYCVALVPVRRIIDWSARRATEGDKHTS